MTIPLEDIANWQLKNMTDKQWRDYTRLAWNISPVLAVYLPTRFKTNEAIISEVKSQVQMNPRCVSHVPDALQYLATTDTFLADSPKLTHMLTWARVSPIQVFLVPYKQNFGKISRRIFCRLSHTSAGNFLSIPFQPSMQ